jgi:hypothetical protein
MPLFGHVSMAAELIEGENRSLKTAAVRPPFSSGFPHFFLKFFLFTPDSF